MTLEPRNFDTDLSKVPRHWANGNVVGTAISNGVNMLFPIGERFFIRSVKHFLDRIDDPVLAQQIRGFFGQEGRHARAHDELNAVMRAQGFEVDAFLARYERIVRTLEARISPELRLAVTAALEHFTANMAEGAFNDPSFDAAAPEMRALLAWHAAEEIEHKAVAFDVLRKVAPSYLLRVTGLVIATLTLATFWAWGSTMLLRQDGVSLREARRRIRAHDELMSRDPIMLRVFARGIREYLRRDFHPNDRDQSKLVADWFAARGMELPEPARSA